jgi:hypothetical protein
VLRRLDFLFVLLLGPAKAAVGESAELEQKYVTAAYVGSDVCVCGGSTWHLSEEVCATPKAWQLRQLTGGSATAGVAALAPHPEQAQLQRVHQSMYTGVTAIDALCPVGRGQSMLLAGSKGCGKSDIARCGRRLLHCLASAGSNQGHSDGPTRGRCALCVGIDSCGCEGAAAVIEG